MTDIIICDDSFHPRMLASSSIPKHMNIMSDPIITTKSLIACSLDFLRGGGLVSLGVSSVVLASVFILLLGNWNIVKIVSHVLTESRLRFN